MDATKRPLLIPPDFATYAEKHGIFEIYKSLLQQILVDKPADPLAYILEFLKRDDIDVPQVIILGPPASGKRSIAKLICGKLRTAHLTAENLIDDAELDLRNEALSYKKKGESVPTELWVRILRTRVKLFDCVKKGWVMDGFPQTREQVIAMQEIGIHPKHCLLLEAPDTVLIERAAGKRVDSKTGEVYHTTFDWPSNSEIQSSLEVVPGNTEADIVDRLVAYHRHIDDVKRCYEKDCRVINADQPKADVFSQAFAFLSKQTRSAAPHTPRVLLLGPTGSGKDVQGALLSNKYNIVKVSCGQLIKQAIADDNKSGKAAKSYLEKGLLVPDSTVLSILQDRLSQLDCVSRGWVLYGYPKTREQAEQLNKAGFIPNRAFFLDIPNDSVIERLTRRSTDPVSGERYHMLYNPPRTQEVKDRLIQHSSDVEEQVKKRLTDYHAYVEEIADFYEEAQHVNADQDPHTVFESIEGMIVNPIPKKYN